MTDDQRAELRILCSAFIASQERMEVAEVRESSAGAESILVTGRRLVAFFNALWGEPPPPVVGHVRGVFFRDYAIFPQIDLSGQICGIQRVHLGTIEDLDDEEE